MYYFSNPTMDSTIYSKYTDINTGLDEILELQKDITTGDISRVLIKFDINNISASLSQNNVSSYNCYLNLYATDAYRLNSSYTIEAYPLSQSWDNGTGEYSSNPSVVDGVSWTYKTENVNWINSGSDYISNISSSQYFNYEFPDIRMDVTNIMNGWISGSYVNNGFLLKKTEEAESSSLDNGSLKFYSKETNTIYIPKLEVVWSDYSYVTGSITGSVLSDTININMINFKSEYKSNTKVKFRLFGRDLYYKKDFSFNNQYMTVRALPTSSYYSIVDVATDRTIIPFSEYSKISLDSTGNYFNLMLDSYLPNRFYKILFNVQKNGFDNYIDDNIVFKVV